MQTNFNTFIPVAVDPERKKFVLDIDGITLDNGESMIFPDGTPLECAEEFMAFVTSEVGALRYCVCNLDNGGCCAYFDDNLSLELQDEIEDLIIDLANSVRKV